MSHDIPPRSAALFCGLLLVAACDPGDDDQSVSTAENSIAAENPDEVLESELEMLDRQLREIEAEQEALDQAAAQE